MSDLPPGRTPKDNESDGWVKTHTYSAVFQEIKQRAHYMRQHPIPAEYALRARLRRKQISGFHFRRQHPIGRFIVDFYCAKARLVIEVDGSIHNQPGQDEYDIQREAFLEDSGLCVLR